MAEVTRFLVDEVRRLSAAVPPEEVLAAARHCVLDWLAGSIAGAEEPLVLPLLKTVAEHGGKPAATVLRHGLRTSAPFAALVNGSMSDALDFADSNQNMRGHSTPAVVAAALAMAELRNLSGRDFLSAVIAGIETETRVGVAMNRTLKPGWHPTGNIAPFGAAACAAKARGLDAARWTQALAIVATQAAGLHNSGGTMSKPFHSGKAAMNGILSASMAEHGFTGRADAIEASEGFLSTRGGDQSIEALMASAGQYLILDTTFKSHAACGLTHETIDNILFLKREQGLDASQVKRVELQVPRLYLRVCNIHEPATGLQAKFSLRAVAAMALLGDDTTSIAAYNDARMADAGMRSLRDRIEVQPKDDLNYVSVTLVETNDGRRLSVRSDARPSSVNKARDPGPVRRKFTTLVAPVLGLDATRRLESHVLGLDRMESVGPLFELSMKHRAKAEAK